MNRVAFWSAQRDLHDETMAHQDYQIGRLVAGLEAAEEWEETLLIIAADHGVAAGTGVDYSLRMRDPLPPSWSLGYRRGGGWGRFGGAGGTGPMLRSGVSRIPLIVVWPGHIAPGQRFSESVSMIDILPTFLDLADLPMPEVMQGQSLAPLLQGEEGWEPRPVILDNFVVDDEGRLGGRIEVVDGRWGASLEINPDPYLPPEDRGLHSLHEERPDLVKKYTEFLETQFAAHQALAEQFTPGEDSPLTPEQLRALRALGYIQ